MFCEVDEIGWYGCPIELLMTLSMTERMEGIPIIIFVDGAQSEQGLSAVDCPKYAGQLAAVFDEVAAGAFDGACANRPAVAQVFSIIHVRLVAAEVIGDLTDGDESGGFLLEALDDEVSATGEEVEVWGLDPHGTLRVGFTIERSTGLPTIFDGMDDVQDDDKVGQPGEYLSLQGLGAIGEGDALEDVLAQASRSSFGQFTNGFFFALEVAKTCLWQGAGRPAGASPFLKRVLVMSSGVRG